MADADKQTILFADVAGSTKLYETLGDDKAQQVIADCLDFLTALTERHRGVVVKTIGDAVMSRFVHADDALRAASDFQTEIAAGRTFAGQPLSLYVGFHYGQTVSREGDTYGDAVNVAARIVDLARAGQILTTGDTVAQLSAADRETTRALDRTTVKGRQAEVSLFEVVWERREEVTFYTEMPLELQQAAVSLSLRHGEREITLNSSHAVFILGRSERADLVVPSPLASREHCRLEYRRGKFYLVDQSTNGTFVRSQESENFYLRREELLLHGGGLISLGQAIAEDGEHLLHYRVNSLLD